MQLIAYDGYTFSTGGYSAGLPDGQNMGNFSLNPQTIERRGIAPSLTGATVSVRSITPTFIYDGATGGLTYENAFQKLLGILDPTNDQARTLTAQLNDGTTVSCQAIVITPHVQSFDELVNGMDITFLSSDPYWRSTTETTVTTTVTADTAVALINGGQARAYPTFKIGYTTQRTTDTAAVGWKWRGRCTITNNTTRDWVAEPICIDLGDTAAIVSAVRAQADGDDLRIRYQGQEYNRTLTNWNTKRTFVHFAFSLKSGASANLEIVSGNPSANAPATMSTRTGTGATYIAYDLEGYSGAASGGSTSVLNDAGAGWEVDRWKNGFIGILSGSGSVRYRRILSNTSTQITFNRVLNSSTGAGATYVLWKSGIFVDGGRVVARSASTMQDDQHTTKWGTNQLAGATVTFIGGSGATPATMTVASNTSDTLTFTGSFSVQPAVGDSYQIERYGVWNYMVDTTIQLSTHRGLYRANKYFTKPTRVWYGDQTPGGWQPTTYLQNRDDFSAMRPYDTGSGGGHASNYWPVLRARRRLQQDARYKDEGNGDGLSLYTGFGLQGMYFDYKTKNVNQVGEFVVAALEPGGEDWAAVVTDSTKRSTLTSVAAQYVDLDAVDNPTRVYMGVLPIDETLMTQTVSNDGTVTSISSTVSTDSSQSWTTNVWTGGTITYNTDSTASPKSATVVSNTGTAITTAAWSTNPTVGDSFTVSRNVSDRDEVEVRTSSTMILYTDLDAFGDLSSSIYSMGAQAAIYDLNAVLRIGGGQNSDQLPYDRVRTGGDNHSLHLASGERLWVRCDPLTTQPMAAVYDSGDTLVYRAPWAVRVYHHETDITGTNTALVSRDFMPIPTQPDLLTNGGFTGGITSWSHTGVDTGTVVFSYDSATYFGSTPGSLKAALNNNSNASYRSTAFTTVIGQQYRWTFKVRGSVVGIDEIAYFKNSVYVKDAGSGATIDSVFDALAGISEANRWFDFGSTFTATSTSYYVEWRPSNAVGSAGNMWLDNVTVGPYNLHISETAVGKLNVAVGFYAGWWG